LGLEIIGGRKDSSDGSLSVDSLSDVDGTVGVDGVLGNDELIVREGIGGQGLETDGESRDVQSVSDGKSSLDVSSVASVRIERDDVEGIPRVDVGRGSSLAGGSITGAVLDHLDVADSKVGSTGSGGGLEGIDGALRRDSGAGLGNVAFSSGGSADGGRSQELAGGRTADTSVAVLSNLNDGVSAGGSGGRRGSRGEGSGEGVVVDLRASGGGRSSRVRGSEDLSVDLSVGSDDVSSRGHDSSPDGDVGQVQSGGSGEVPHDLALDGCVSVDLEVGHAGSGRSDDVDEDQLGVVGDREGNSVGSGKIGSLDGEDAISLQGREGDGSVLDSGGSSGGISSVRGGGRGQSLDSSLNDATPVLLGDGAVKDDLDRRGGVLASVNDGSSVDLSVVPVDGSSNNEGGLIIGMILAMDLTELDALVVGGVSGVCHAIDGVIVEVDISSSGQSTFGIGIGAVDISSNEQIEVLGVATHGASQEGGQYNETLDLHSF